MADPKVRYLERCALWGELAWTGCVDNMWGDKPLVIPVPSTVQRPILIVCPMPNQLF